jgi:hypothetical protein
MNAEVKEEKYLSGVYRKCLGTLFSHASCSEKKCRLCRKLERVWPVTEHGVILKMEAVHSSEISEQAKHSVKVKQSRYRPEVAQRFPGS